MRTARDKGLEFQRWIARWLTEQGWIVRNFPPVPKRIWDQKKKRFIFISLKNDAWGADLVARRRGRLLWIQATIDTHVQRKVDMLKEYFKVRLPGEEVHIWLKAVPSKAQGAPKASRGQVNIKQVHIEQSGETNGKYKIKIVDIGKIVRKKFKPEEEGYEL